MIEDIEGNIAIGNLQIIEGKGEDEEPSEEVEENELKGKELVVVEP
jgi:hypothetical protein